MTNSPARILCMFFLCFTAGFAQNTERTATRPLNFEQLFANEEHPVKCGVPAMLHLLNLNKDRQDEVFAQFGRPSLPESYVTPSGRFRLHYTLVGPHAVPGEITNNAGVPDWVYEAGMAAEYVHKLLVDTLGFMPPATDNNIDGPEFDIYFQTMRDLYGAAFIEGNGDQFHSYLEIENDFSENFYTKGIDAVKVTVAHEYFHAIHFGYARRTDVEDEIFFYEMSSTWFEDRAYDDINDYYGYISDFFTRPELPPFEFSINDTRIYALSIFFKYWFKNHADVGLQSMWDNFRTMRGLEALEKEINAQGVTFATALTEFYGWCLYTGFRADPEHYFKEGAQYPMIKVIDTLQVDQRSAATVNVNALGARFVKLDFLPGKIFTAKIDVGPNDGRIAAVGVKSNGRLWDLSFGASFKLASEYNEGGAFIAIVNGTIPPSQAAPYDFANFRVALNAKASDDDVTKFSLSPNPFRIGSSVEEVTINYDAPDTNPFKIKIFTEAGQMVWEKTPNNRYFETWSGRDLDGALVPAGIYFVVVPDFEKKENRVLKLAVIR